MGQELPTEGKAITPSTKEVEENYYQCEVEWRRKSIITRAYPRMITIETTSVCNLDCVMCLHGVEKNGDYKHFPASLLPNLAEVIPHARIVQLHGLGEPLMNPDFWKMLALTHENQHVAINTNGALINKKNADALLDSSISEVNFSLDAATGGTYRKIRGFDFNRVLENIRYFIEERNRRGNKKPVVFINMTMMRENIEEAADFVTLGVELGVDKVLLWHLNAIAPERKWVVARGDWVFDYHAQHLRNHPDLSNERIRAAIARANELGVHLILDGTRALFYEEKTEKSNSPQTEAGVENQTEHGNTAQGSEAAKDGTKDCVFPWGWLLVQQNGCVLPCCFGSNEPLGNLHELSALQIWNGGGYRRLRKNALANRIDTACAGGTCKFANGRPASDILEQSVKHGVKLWVAAAYHGLKKLVKAIVSERIWGFAISVFRRLVATAIVLGDVPVFAWDRVSRFGFNFMERLKRLKPRKPFDPKQSLTREDVIKAYNYILRRDPESDEAIEHHLRRWGTLEELLDILIKSDEFKNRLDI
jgi:MoaA/NifB/PqqE/SkfB family radical SAM enzyme